MMNKNLVVYSAFGTAACWILSLVFFGLEFSVSLIFGTFANIASALALILLVVVILFSYQLYQSRDRVSSTIITIVAFAGILITLAGYLRLIGSSAAFSEVVVQLYLGYGLIGLWMLFSSLMNIQHQLLPGWLSLTGGLAGSGLILLLVVTLLGTDPFAFNESSSGSGGLLSIIGLAAGAIAYLAYPIWSVGMGRFATRARIATI